LFATKDASAARAVAANLEVGTPLDQKRAKAQAVYMKLVIKWNHSQQFASYTGEKDASSMTSGCQLAVLNKMWHEKHICDRVTVLLACTYSYNRGLISYQKREKKLPK
jgi:hypothetical protein